MAVMSHRKLRPQ